jgi:hypothetical protein
MHVLNGMSFAFIQRFLMAYSAHLNTIQTIVDGFEYARHDVHVKRIA